MAGHLHDDVGAALPVHPGEELLDLIGLRRGPFRRQHQIADHVVVGPEQAHLGPGLLLQDRLDQIGGGGFPVGAGDPHDLHLLRGPVKPVGGDQRKSLSGVRRLHVRDLSLRRVLAQDTGGAFFHGHGDVLMSVADVTHHGYKQAARRDFSGVKAYARDFRIPIGI